MKPRTVLKCHNASYEDPIKVATGERLTPTGRQEIWDGHRWLWAIAEDGREGWVPDDLITEIDGRTVACRAYSAVELTCAAGEAVEVFCETHGWAWCRNGGGREGWLPLKTLLA